MSSVVCLFVMEAQGASSRLTHGKHGLSALLEVVRREAANTQGWPVPNNTTKAAISFGSLKKDTESLKIE